MSTSVTASPSAAKIDAYSTPMTPAPSTIIDRGIRGRRSTVVLSNTVSSSNAMSAGRLGAEPVAITITSPRKPQPDLPVDAVHGDRVRVEEPPLAPEDLDRVAAQRAVDQLELPLHDALLAVHQLGDRDRVGDLHLDGVELVVPQAVDERRALAQGLARDGAPVHPHPADDVLALDQRDAFTGAGRLDRGALAAGTAAKNDHIETDHGCSLA